MPNSQSINLSKIDLSKLSELSISEPDTRQSISFRRSNFPFMISMNSNSTEFFELLKDYVPFESRKHVLWVESNSGNRNHFSGYFLDIDDSAIFVVNDNSETCQLNFDEIESFDCKEIDQDKAHAICALRIVHSLSRTTVKHEAFNKAALRALFNYENNPAKAIGEFAALTAHTSYLDVDVSAYRYRLDKESFYFLAKLKDLLVGCTSDFRMDAWKAYYSALSDESRYYLF